MILTGRSGFSLVEILVALVILSIAFVGIQVGFNVSGSKLDSTVITIEKAFAFADSEAILRNTIVRVRFDMTKNPMEYVIEYGSSEMTVLPEFKKGLVTDRKTEERLIKSKDSIDQSFLKVTELSDANRILDPAVRIVGIGTSLYDWFTSNEDVSVYLYPTGERDSALIVLATIDQLVSLEIEPFSQKIHTEYHEIDTKMPTIDIEKFQTVKAREIYEEWLKN